MVLFILCVIIFLVAKINFLCSSRSLYIIICCQSVTTIVNMDPCHPMAQIVAARSQHLPCHPPPPQTKDKLSIEALSSLWPHCSCQWVILRRLFHAFWVDFTQDAILHQLIWMRCCDAIVVQKERSSESSASSWAVYTLSPGLTVAIFGGTWQWVHGAAAHGAMLPQIAQMPIQVKPSRGNSFDTRFKMIQIHFATLFVCHGWKALLFTIPQDVFGCFLPWMWHDVAFKHLDSPFMTNWMVQPDAASRNESLLRERERCLTKSKMHHKYVVIQLNTNRHEYGDYEAGFSISVMLLM